LSRDILYAQTAFQPAGTQQLPRARFGLRWFWLGYFADVFILSIHHRLDRSPHGTSTCMPSGTIHPAIVASAAK
jgi:hypothetical protein